MSTPYETVYQSFLNRVEMADFLNLDEEAQDEQLQLWLDTAIGYIEANGLNLIHDVTQRDDLFKEFADTLKPWEIQVVALFMVGVWYEQKINSLEHTLLMVGSSGEKWTNQSKHMQVMKEVRQAVIQEARSLVREHGFTHNSYIGD